MKKFAKMWLAIAVCWALAGGGPSVPIASAEAPTVASNDVSEELFVFVAGDASQNVRRGLEKEISRFIGESSSAGDALHVIETPTHEHVATVTVPGGLAKTRMRNPSIRPQLQRLGQFLRAEAAGNSNSTSGQLNLVRVASTIKGLRRSSSPARIVFIADPIFHDEQHAGWSMKNGLVPSDASLTAAACPFHEEAMLPESVDVRWLTPSEDWGYDQVHRNAVTRFYQMYIEKQSGRLTRVTVDPAVAFDSQPVDDAVALAGVTPNDDPYVGMRSVVQSSRQVARENHVTDVPVVERHTRITVEDAAKGEESAAAPSVGELTQRALADPDRIFVAINWEKDGGSQRQCDIDLWISGKGSPEELSFSNLEVDFGRLYRDVQRAGRIDGNAQRFKAWECAEISHGRLEDLTVWLNAYSTDGPSRVRLIAVWKKQLRQTFIDLDVAEGDGAANRSRRESSGAWKKVNLAELFAGESTNTVDR